MSKQTAIGVSQIIERQNVALSQSLQDAWYKVSAEAVAAVNQGLKPREKVLADGVVKLMDAGINVIPYHKDGKLRSPTMWMLRCAAISPPRCPRRGDAWR